MTSRGSFLQITGSVGLLTAARLLSVSNQNAQSSNTKENAFGLTETLELQPPEQADQHCTLVLHLSEERKI